MYVQPGIATSFRGHLDVHAQERVHGDRSPSVVEHGRGSVLAVEEISEGENDLAPQ